MVHGRAVQKSGRRVKWLEADPTLLMRVIAGIDNGDTWRVPMALDLPTGARVVDVNYDCREHVFIFRIECAHFSEVPPGSQMPEICVQYTDVEISKDAPARIADYEAELGMVAGELERLARTPWIDQEALALVLGECNSVVEKLEEIAGNIRTGLAMQRKGSQ